jgi:curved DNA-binding protein CbpA
MADLYEILGVQRTAPTAEIRKAYLTLAREQHPDRFADPAEKARAQEAFQQATEAFNTLCNERARADYDASLSKPKLTTPDEIAADAYATGLARLESSDAAGAVEALRQAAYLVPGEARYHAALGRALSRDPHLAREAVQSLEQAARLAPQNPQIQLELALLLEKQGLHIRARRAAEAALLLAPGDPAVMRAVARLGLEPSGPGNAGRRKP